MKRMRRIGMRMMATLLLDACFWYSSTASLAAALLLPPLFEGCRDKVSFSEPFELAPPVFRPRSIDPGAPVVLLPVAAPAVSCDMILR